MLKKSILLASLFLLFIGGIIYLLSSSSPEKTLIGSGNLFEGTPKETLDAPNVSGRGATHKIIDKEGLDKTEIIYKNGKFFPAVVTLEQDNSGIGCLITIVNRSEAPLTIRLSPHTERTDWGAQYDAIPPRGELIIDPRFRIPKIAFHNHGKPSEEFSVNLRSSCAIF